MASIQTVCKAEINPLNPVPEICSLITAISEFHPGREEEILCGIRDAIDRRLSKLQKGIDKNVQPVVRPDAEQQDQ